MSIWDRLVRRKPETEFAGAPAVRRIKSYSAQTGYVYQYYFDGSRDSADGKEYRFLVRGNTPDYKAILVDVRETLVCQWASQHGRELTTTEQYAVAKMLLFKHFDEGSTERALGARIVLTPTDLERISIELDLE